MKLIFFLLINLFLLNKNHCQSNINFILEINDKLVEELSAYHFMLNYSLDLREDSIHVAYTLGELQMTQDEYSILKNLPDSTIVQASFKTGDFFSQPVSFSFALEKRFFFQRYLYIRFYDGQTKNGKCGWEYDSPINMRRLPTRRKRFLFWYRLINECPD